MGDLKAQPVMGRRSSSKLKALKIDDRMLLQMPRLGMALEEQLEYLGVLYPEGGQRAMQALLNLMQSGVVDGVIWKRESWVGDSVGSVTGVEEDKLDLLSPVAMPPTGGCNLMYTEGVVEAMLNQLHESVFQTMNKHAASAEPIEVLAVDVTRQVVMLVHRIRFTKDVQGCIRENRQLKVVSRANAEIKRKINEKLLNKDIEGGERATLMAIQQILHEQSEVCELLVPLQQKGTVEELEGLWKEQMRFYHDEKENTIELKFGEKIIKVGHEYYPPRMLITTEFTHTLRWAYLNTMAGDGEGRLLVLIGPPGCGKTGMLDNVGSLLGTLPTIIRVNEKVPADEKWWQRKMAAAVRSGGGSLAPVILTQAHRASEEVMTVALKVAESIPEIALCVTMTPGPGADRLEKGVLAGAAKINVPPSDLKVIAAGQLAAEGLTDSDALAKPLSDCLLQLAELCKVDGKVPAHYDFGPRTLMQLCTQISAGRKKGIEEKITVVEVLERCLLPKMVKDDVPKLRQVLKDCFGVDKPSMISASQADDGRWHRVAENIKTITKIEPDCMVLPVSPEEETGFYEEFYKMLNRHGSAMVKLEQDGKPVKLDQLTPEQLLGTMPKRDASGKWEELKDGILVTALKKAMEDFADPFQTVWVVMETGNVGADIWESLHELLNDSGCINLATGEQIRLNPNLRFLFVMPNAGSTSPDTFSRSAVVYTDPA